MVTLQVAGQRQSQDANKKQSPFYEELRGSWRQYRSLSSMQDTVGFIDLYKSFVIEIHGAPLG